MRRSAAEWIVALWRLVRPEWRGSRRGSEGRSRRRLERTGLPLAIAEGIWLLIGQLLLALLSLLPLLSLLSLLVEYCDEIPLIILLAVVVDLDRILIGIRCDPNDTATGNRLADFSPFASGQNARVALIDRDSDGLADIVTALGPGSAPTVKSFKGTTLASLGQFNAYDPSFLGGVFVG